MSKNKSDGIKINDVARITGLTPHLLRAWEKRYQVVSPERPGRGRRYSYQEVEHLKGLKQLVDQGTPIRKASQLLKFQPGLALGSENIQESRHDLLQLVKKYKLNQLSKKLSEHRQRRGTEEFLIGLVCPLMSDIGRMVAHGELNIGQEHAVSALVRDQIVRIRVPRPKSSLPLIGFCTPEDDFHELGILIASKIAEAQGFSVLSFGANLPADSLVDLVQALKPEIVVVAAAAIESNLRNFRDYLRRWAQLRSSAKLWVAGPLAEEYRSSHVTLSSMRDFADRLNELRR